MEQPVEVRQKSIPGKGNPMINPQAIDITKKRILNILNSKLSKRVAQ
jgi:hypothetical protein